MPDRELIEKLQHEVAALREALAYYADERHYDEQGVVIGRGAGPSYVGAGDPQEAWYEGDFGAKAREALAAVSSGAAVEGK